MKRFRTETIALRAEYSRGQRFDALAGAFLLSSLLFLPLFAALGELIIVLMHLRVAIFLGITLAAILWIVVLVKLDLQALGLKKPAHAADLKYLFRLRSLIAAAAVLILGLAFTFILLPIIWV